MTESTLTKKFCDAYRARRPEAEVWKISDRVARSRPDVQITDYGQTWFLECKRAEGGRVSPGQQQMALRLARASRGRMITGWFGADGSVRFVIGGDSPIACRTIAEAAAWIETRLAERA